jgi:hypothetical protein
MAVATMAVQQWTTVTPTKTTVTTPRLSTMESAAPGTSNPIPIPASGFNYSFWASFFLTCTNFGTATLVNNHKFYSDGSIGWNCGTGGGLYVCSKTTGDKGLPTASYALATYVTGAVGTSGDPVNDTTNGHPYYKTGTSNYLAAVKADTLTSASPMIVDATTQLAATGNFNGVVLQAKVDTAGNGAVRGAQAAETLTFVYDEV